MRISPSCYYVYVIFCVLFFFGVLYLFSFTIFSSVYQTRLVPYTYGRSDVQLQDCQCLRVYIQLYRVFYSPTPTSTKQGERERRRALSTCDFTKRKGKRKRDLRFNTSMIRSKRSAISRYVCVYIHINTVVCTSWYILYVQSYNC